LANISIVSFDFDFWALISSFDFDYRFRVSISTIDFEFRFWKYCMRKYTGSRTIGMEFHEISRDPTLLGYARGYRGMPQEGTGSKKIRTSGVGNQTGFKTLLRNGTYILYIWDTKFKSILGCKIYIPFLEKKTGESFRTLEIYNFSEIIELFLKILNFFWNFELFFEILDVCFLRN